MSRLPLVSSVLFLTTLLVVCSSNASTSHVRPAPSGFVLQPDISDPGCNVGRGVRLAAHLGGIPVVVSGAMPDGSTLVASSGYPTLRSVELHSVTALCAPNRAFGNEGVATVILPLRPRPGNPPADGVPPNGLWVNAVAPRRGGGAILAGTYGNDWVVGEVTASGRIDRTFGDHGWTVLPFPGEVSAALQEPSGRIIIAGDNGGGGCCTLNWAAAISARGRIEKSFGTRGREELPTGGDSGVEGLALEPNGDVLATVGYGNNGCWGVALAMLLPSGQPVPQFAKRLDRFWHGLAFGAFVADVYVDGDGFTLVGTGEKQCDGYRPPRAAGLIARFRTDGKPAGATVRFPSRMYGEVHAFREGEDIFLVLVPYADQTQLTVTARRPDGSVDPRFGSRGRASIRTPWRGREAALETMVSVNRANPGTLVVVATEDGRKQLQVIRVRL